MTYKLIFAPEFARDFENTFDYISQTLTSPKAAAKLMKDIDSAIVNLKEFPEIHPLGREPLDVLGYRKLIIKNYTVIYSVDHKKEEVHLLRCFYGRRDYQKFFM